MFPRKHKIYKMFKLGSVILTEEHINTFVLLDWVPRGENSYTIQFHYSGGRIILSDRIEGNQLNEFVDQIYKDLTEIKKTLKKEEKKITSLEQKNYPFLQDENYLKIYQILRALILQEKDEKAERDQDKRDPNVIWCHFDLFKDEVAKEKSEDCRHQRYFYLIESLLEAGLNKEDEYLELLCQKMPETLRCDHFISCFYQQKYNLSLRREN